MSKPRDIAPLTKDINLFTRPKNFVRANRTALSGQRRYVDFQADMWLCNTALLQVALSRCPNPDDYLDTIALWNKPAMREVAAYTEQFNKGLSETTEQVELDLGLADRLAQRSEEMSKSHPKTADEVARELLPVAEAFVNRLMESRSELASELLAIIDKIKNFMTYAFNREVDTQNQTLKITAESSRALFHVIIFNSYCSNLNKTLDDFDVERGIEPIDRLSKREKAKRLKCYKALHLTLHNDRTYLNEAEEWHKCRVNPGSITEVAQDLSNAQKRHFPTVKKLLESRIRRCDIAAGYPLKD